MPTRTYCHWHFPSDAEIAEFERKKFLASLRKRANGHRY